MAMTTGGEILARAMRQQKIDTMFYLMGGPLMDAQAACIKEGIRCIDVRHEQAAAMMANAWARLLNRVGVCMGASGPGTTNLITGVAHAWADAAPLLTIGGSAPGNRLGRGIFQEVDQVAMFKPITKWAERCVDPRRLPEMLSTAMRQAVSGRPGPVYLDLPGDMLYREVDESDVPYPNPELALTRARPLGDPAAIEEAMKLLERAQRPIVISGSGILWSDGCQELTRFVEASGIPFYTTPQGRGVLPDDHALSFLAARATAFKEADLLLIVGTRSNYIFGHFMPPRFSADARVIQVNIDAAEIGSYRACDVGIAGDAKAVLRQFAELGKGRLKADRHAAWTRHLADVNKAKSAAAEEQMSTSRMPVHPLRLCKEIRDFLDRDAILVVDGQDILNIGRQSIPTFAPGHRLNSGVFGTMGVGLPFGIGAKVAKPDKQVLVLHGDGSFGINAMELDTAARFKIPVVTVISLNGGWGSDLPAGKAGRQLGYTRFEKMAESLGCHGEYVEDPAKIRPALERAFKSGLPAVVNVKTDDQVRARTAAFGGYQN
jgi:thiamine pyrophosphate-dependent acetolactate synthase large subunit-like protein